jgi:RecJ-like exonuclease
MQWLKLICFKKAKWKMKFDITFWCDKCDGHGTVEDVKTGVHDFSPYVDFYEVRCEECGGSGESYHEEIFDSLDDAKNQYPKATLIEYCQEGDRK